MRVFVHIKRVGNNLLHIKIIFAVKIIAQVKRLVFVRQVFDVIELFVLVQSLADAENFFAAGEQVGQLNQAVIIVVADFFEKTAGKGKRFFIISGEVFGFNVRVDKIMGNANRRGIGKTDFTQVIVAFNTVRNFGDGFVFNSSDVVQKPENISNVGVELSGLAGDVLGNLATLNTWIPCSKIIRWLEPW